MRLLIVGIVAFLLGCALAHRVVSNKSDVRSMYEEFKRKYNKTITDDDIRFAIFCSNLDRIDQVQKNEQGTARYGVTEFAVLTAEEFAATYTNTPMEMQDLNPAVTLEDLPVPPSEKDWRSENKTSAVPDQGSCGAGWAFAAIGNIESQWAIKYGKLFHLSAQQLLDCDRWSQKCHGGSPRRAIDEIIKIGGIMMNYDYPYTGHPSQCEYGKEKSYLLVLGVTTLPQNERKQTAYLAKYGPLIVTLNAAGLQFYQTGVMNQGRSCDVDNLNHAGLTVGYGTEEDLDYWIVRNSWGKQWGEEGHFRITRGEGTCGIDRLVSSAKI